MYRFPRRLFRPRTPASPDAVRDALRPFQQLHGHYNSHNFSNALQLTTAQLNDDIAYRVASGGERDDDGYIYNTDADAGGSTDLIDLGHSTGWTAIRGTRLDVTSEGSLFFAWASAQFYTSSTASSMAQLRFAILLDGSPVSESVVGLLDEGSISTYMERGLCGERGACNVEAVFPIPSGVHEIALGVRINGIDGVNTKPPVVSIHARDYFYWEIAR